MLPAFTPHFAKVPHTTQRVDQALCRQSLSLWNIQACRNSVSLWNTHVNKITVYIEKSCAH